VGLASGRFWRKAVVRAKGCATKFAVDRQIKPKLGRERGFDLPRRVGLLVGVVNGLLVGKHRASAAIVTLAVNIVLIGMVEYFVNGKPPGDVPTSLFLHSRPGGALAEEPAIGLDIKI
jgi:hypothetical protein